LICSDTNCCNKLEIGVGKKKRSQSLRLKRHREMSRERRREMETERIDGIRGEKRNLRDATSRVVTCEFTR